MSVESLHCAQFLKVVESENRDVLKHKEGETFCAPPIRRRSRHAARRRLEDVRPLAHARDRRAPPAAGRGRRPAAMRHPARGRKYFCTFVAN